jgi:hypothetical protein
MGHLGPITIWNLDRHQTVATIIPPQLAWRVRFNGNRSISASSVDDGGRGRTLWTWEIPEFPAEETGALPPATEDKKQIPVDKK